MTSPLPQRGCGLAQVRQAKCDQFWSQGCDGCEGEHFSISALRSGNDGSEWSEGEQPPSGRPLSVSAQGMPAQGIPRLYAVRPWVICRMPVPPEARYFSPPPSPPTPPSCSPSKSSWAGQTGLRSRRAKYSRLFRIKRIQDPIILLLLLLSMCCRRQYQIPGFT